MVSTVLTVLLSFLVTQVRSSAKVGCFNEVCKACGVYYHERGPKGTGNSGVISYQAFRLNTDEKIWNITITKEYREEGRTWTKNFLGTRLEIKGGPSAENCGVLEADYWQPPSPPPGGRPKPTLPPEYGPPATRPPQGLGGGGGGSAIEDLCKDDDKRTDVCQCSRTLVENDANAAPGMGPRITFDTQKRCDPSGVSAFSLAVGGGGVGAGSGGFGGGLGGGGGSLLPPGGGKSAGRVCLSVPLAWSLYLPSAPDASTTLQSTAPFFCFSYPAGGIFFLPQLPPSPNRTLPTTSSDNQVGYY